MLEFLRDQFFVPGEGFMPHGMCLSWQPGALWLNVGADALIVLAYLSIPLILMSFIRQRDDIAFRGVIQLFAAFIFFCALTHASGIWVVWNPDFIAQGMLKFVAAVISLCTAFALWRIIPKALAIPNPSQLTDANAKLAEANATLEAKVRERTKELEDTRNLLQSMIDAMPVEGAHRDRAGRLKVWNVPFATRFQADTDTPVRTDMPHEEMFLARMSAKGVNPADCDEAWEEAAIAYDDLQPR